MNVAAPKSRVAPLALLVRYAAVLALAACRAPEAPPPAPIGLAVPPLDAGGAQAIADEGVRFGHPATTVGARSRISVRATSHAPDSAGGEQIATYVSELRIEVLAVDGPAPSRVRVAFAKNVHVTQGREVATSIDGRTYEVSTQAPEVRDAAGAPVPEEQAQRVLDVLPDLGTRARVDQVLPERAMKIGERRDEVASAVLRVVHPRAWTAREAHATLVRAAGDEAAFALALDAASDTGVRMKLTGEAAIRISDSRLVRVALDGSYEHDGDPPGTFSYRRAVD